MKIIKPRISEKTMMLAQKGWYTFTVEKYARKELIAKEIGSLYNVSVIDVRTVMRKGKTRRTGRKMMNTQRPDWKVAMVRLVKGQKIPVFDITPEGKTA